MTADLIQRLEAAEVGSRELDAEVFCLFYDEPDRRARATVGGGAIIYGPGLEARVAEIPRYTTSLDAALALVERVLPEWRIDISYTAHERRIGTFVRLGGDHLVHEPVAIAHRNGPVPLALCIALLRSQEGQAQ